MSARTLRIAVIRVAFQDDSSPATTGDGTFVLIDTFNQECSEWTLDPAPHGRQYFQDHLESANNYWQRVSAGHVNIDLNNSTVFPEDESGAYELPHDMLYYHPYLEDFDETEKLFELSRDALELADDDIDFNNYSTIILVHAGMGGDFAFALDPTPGNIPSAYLSQSDFLEYGPLETFEKDLDDLIIIPESQNFLQYKETRALFADAEDPCFYQVGLNGTIALMLGFHLGLPPLYNTESGRSLVGGFALMDQGSNNFHGIVPAFPNPYSRISMDWISPRIGSIGDQISLGVAEAPVLVPISEHEYYLLENRQRNLTEPDDMIQWIDKALYDTVSVELSPGGVVLSVDEQHAGLPGNGLYIWHVDENAWYTDDNPNGGSIQLIDFVEADGAQDMGHSTQLLFADYLETGWWFDPWFAGNEGWFHLNRNQDIVGDSLLSFDSSTFPATTSNTGIPSHLRIENISKNGSTMSFSIASDRVLNTASISSFIGWAGSDQVWAFNLDSSEVLKGSFVAGELYTTINALVTPAKIFASSVDSTFIFRYPWIVTQVPNGVRFLNIESGALHYNTSVKEAFEISIGAAQEVYYYAHKDDGYAMVKWSPSSGSSTIEPLISEPMTRFQTTSGIQNIFGDSDQNPFPVGVNPKRQPGAPDQIIETDLDVISWSNSMGKLKISHLPQNTEKYLSVEKPTWIIPFDADQDGNYEIALFYDNSIRIINQTGILWNGSPFSVATYYGNPLIGAMNDGELGIFLRHDLGYTIHTPAGRIADTGVLPRVTDDLDNYLRIGMDRNLLQIGGHLIYFDHLENLDASQYWTEPQGRFQGDRIVKIDAGIETVKADIRPGSAYNYPNPAKGSKTTIRAWIGAVDTWSIEIFSLSGAQVSYVEEDVHQQNAYNEWVWDTSSFSNGVFIAQIVAGKEAEIIKIAIIR